MKSRVLFIVGLLAILVGIWWVSLERYNEEQKGVEKNLEEQKESSEKPYMHKRFPANGKIIKAPKSSNLNPPQFVERKPAAFTKVNIIPSQVFKMGSKRFALVEGVNVVDSKERSSYEPENIIDEKFNKLLVKGPIHGDSQGLVVQNQRTKRLGIMTGVFKIKLKDFQNWSELKEENDLVLEGNFPGIRLSLLKTTNLDEIESLMTKFSGDQRIERVELEILESPAVSK